MKVIAKIHSKKGEEEQVTIISQSYDNNLGMTRYIVQLENGIKCTAVWNPFCSRYFADDIYGIIE